MNDMLNEVVDCPTCGRKTVYGQMIWLNGICDCPACYIKRRAQLDYELKKGNSNG